MRNYGRILQDMIAYACTIENQAEREALTLYIAQCMRQKNYVWNRDQESGMARVREDIIRLSDGRLECDLTEFSELPNNTSDGKNKKRKNKN